jgi:hypothetical protein
MDTLTVPINSLTLDPSNARRHSDVNLRAIAHSLSRFGQRKPIVVRGLQVLAGNGTLEAALSLGWTEIQIVQVPEDWDNDTAMAYALADNRTAELAEWDETRLATQLLELENRDWDIEALGFEREIPPVEATVEPAPTLAERFIIPPLSIFDQRGGEWRARKQRWIQLGIKSEIGRDGGATLNSLSGRIPNYYFQKAKTENSIGRALSNEEFERDYLVIPDGGGLSSSGTSVFDPVLCEIAYRWWSPVDGEILDPFAGGSVRGVVASALQRRYTGVDLRAEQIAANQEQWTDIQTRLEADVPTPTWITGDSTALDAFLPAEYRADLIFSCPPYGDLEVYSDSPADLSQMSYEDFLVAYREIIRASIARLKDDRFAVWVVGDIRESKDGGCYRGLIHDTVRAFEDAGARLYNEAILISPVGSLAVRVARFFTTSRKLGKTHQQVLVFVKGDPKKATQACGDVEVEQVLIEGSDL